MAGTSVFVLGVALLTWGGVFLYLLRLASLAKSLEAQLKSHQAQREEERAASLRTEALRAESSLGEASPDEASQVETGASRL